MLINAQLKIWCNNQPKTRLEAEYPMKGSELIPPNSSRYELEVRNAILLYEYLIDNVIMQQVNITMKMKSKYNVTKKMWSK